MDDIPEWALREFCKRANLDYGAVMNGAVVMVATRSAVRVGAALIAQHEEPPVDPLLPEARKIVADRYTAQGWDNSAELVLSGKFDGHCDVTTALAALKRGVELAKAGVA